METPSAGRKRDGRSGPMDRRLAPAARILLSLAAGLVLAVRLAPAASAPAPGEGATVAGAGAGQEAKRVPRTRTFGLPTDSTRKLVASAVNWMC